MEKEDIKLVLAIVGGVTIAAVAAAIFITLITVFAEWYLA